MAAKFEIYQDKAAEFRFRLKAGNGENILASEGYSSKAACQNGIESVKKNAADDDRYEKKQLQAVSDLISKPPITKLSAPVKHIKVLPVAIMVLNQ